MTDRTTEPASAGPADPPQPWRIVTRETGLMLHAAARYQVPVVPLLDEFAVLDATVGPAGRTFLCPDRSWSAIPLIERRVQAADGAPQDGVATPALPCMPGVPDLLDRMRWRPLAVYVLRQPPRGLLPWHFDAQALHLPDCRVLLPIIAPPGAVTLIGHEAAAYPAGAVWTADFSLPHQVENRADEQRVVLAFDLRSDDAVRALFPDALAARPAERKALAGLARNHLLHWRATQAKRAVSAPQRQEAR